MITDTHAHVFWKSFDEDREAVMIRARDAGVTRMVVVGTDLPTSRAALELCRDELEAYPTAGIHPHDAQGIDDAVRDEIESLCSLPECVAVGETGLDFFKEYSPRRAQLDGFHWQLDLARRLDKPVVVHCRDAWEETAQAIAAFPGVRGVMHCYTYGPSELEPFLEAGFHVSFSGVVTYKANDKNREAARLVPPDRLVVETDCPFLAPEPLRGKRNEPAFVAHVLACVARVREEDVHELAHSTSANAARLFDLPPLPAPAGP